MITPLARARRLPLPLLLLLLAIPAAAQQPAAPSTGASALTPGGAATAWDASPWLEDFAAMRAALATSYANLDWIARTRRIALPALADSTERRIRAAGSDAVARLELQRFVNAFGDGHVRIIWATSASSAAPAPDASPSAASPAPCARLGVRPRPDRRAVPFHTLGAAWRSLAPPDSADFPYGLLSLPDGRRIGVLRIALFTEEVHPALCAQLAGELVSELASDSSSACNDRCLGALRQRLRDEMTAAVERRVRTLADSGAVALALDLVGNGGGTEWAEVVARTLTPVPLRSARTGVLRHPHPRRSIEGRLAELTAARPRTRAGTTERALVDSALAAYRMALQAAATPSCDRQAVWTDAAALERCPGLATDVPIHVTGALATADREALRTRPARDALFWPAAFRYEVGAWAGPLVILADRGTASASEELIAMMQDAGAATIVGARTAGAGCGYTNGGIPIVLPRSGARLRVPDCARLRRDGSNEVDGITPDVTVAWQRGDAPAHAATLAVEGIVAALARPAAPR